MVSRAAALLAIALFASKGALAGQIQWRVQAGFAPFGYLADPSAASSVWLPKSKESGETTLESWYSDLYSAGHLKHSPYAEWLVPNPARKPPWNQHTGQYEPSYVHPSSTTIAARFDHAEGECTWRVIREGREVEALRTVANCSSDAPIKEIRLAGDRLVVSNGAASDEVDIKIEHLVVVGLGDSYASGEGNPDRPTQWQATSAPKDSFAWVLPRKDEESSLVSQDATWADHDCHRSFFNYQTFSALKLAAENPHRLVTFLHYACTGAEILDGLLVRQYLPGGMDRRCLREARRDRGRAQAGVRENCFLRQSQFASMVSDLCVRPATSSSIAASRLRAARTQAADLISKGRISYKLEAYRDTGFDVPACDEVRKPDLVLLSVGGNDSGFAQLVAWAVLPTRARDGLLGVPSAFFRLARGANVVCPEYGRADDESCPRTDHQLARQLPYRFAVMQSFLEASMPGIATRVVLNSYPVAVTKPGGLSGVVCGDNMGCDPRNAWDGARAFVPSGRAKRCLGRRGDWHFNVRESEVDSLVFKGAGRERASVPLIQGQIRRAAEFHGYRFADSVGGAFDQQGFCRQDPGDMPISLPSRAPDEWVYSDAQVGSVTGAPRLWDAYRPAGRYIRTINDALLTMTSDRGDAMSGTFHPTAQGHAAVADAAWPAIQAAINAHDAGEALRESHR